MRLAALTVLVLPFEWSCSNCEPPEFPLFLKLTPFPDFGLLPSLNRWRENVQFGFVIEPQQLPNAQTLKTKVIIVLTQEDVRMTGNSKW